MTIRRLTEADARQYWDLRLDALRSAPFAFGPTVADHLRSTVEDTARQIGSLKNGSFVLGCFDESTLAGSARFVREEGAKESHKGSLRGLFVRQSHRRTGVGRALVSEALRQAAEDPALEQILLTVTATQEAALELYSQFGFQRYGTEPRALCVDGQYVDEHYLILRLRRQAARRL